MDCCCLLRLLLVAAKTSPQALESLTTKIASAVQKSGVGGISYDLAADALVGVELMRLLPPGTKRYAWTLDWSYENKDLAEKMGARPQISRLLVRWITPFNL